MHSKRPVSKSLKSEKSTCRPSIEKHARSRRCSSQPFASKKPCALLDLPCELRLQIYSYILPTEYDVQFREWRFPKVQDPILLLFSVCHVIRVESRHEFFTKTHFRLPCVTFRSRNVLENWLSILSPTDRSLLGQNANVTLPITLRGEEYARDPIPATYHAWNATNAFNVPKRLEEHNAYLWKDCKRFGNVYEISRWKDKTRFGSFCKLASWLLWCAEPIAKDINWSYEIHIQPRSQFDDSIENLKNWLRHNLEAAALHCVQTAWVRERREAEMKKQALGMLEAVNRRMQLCRKVKGLPPLGDEDWNRKITSLRQFFDKW